MKLNQSCIAELNNYINNTKDWNNYRRFGGDGRVVRSRDRIYCCKRLRFPLKTEQNVLKKIQNKLGWIEIISVSSSIFKIFPKNSKETKTNKSYMWFACH